jgi:hypothetical protein
VGETAGRLGQRGDLVEIGTVWRRRPQIHAGVDEGRDLFVLLREKRDEIQASHLLQLSGGERPRICSVRRGEGAERFRGGGRALLGLGLADRIHDAAHEALQSLVKKGALYNQGGKYKPSTVTVP